MRISSFIGYPEISDFDPQTRYFHENVKKPTFQKMAVFGGAMSKIEFGENWRDRYGLYYGIGFNGGIHDFP